MEEVLAAEAVTDIALATVGAAGEIGLVAGSVSPEVQVEQQHIMLTVCCV